MSEVSHGKSDQQNGEEEKVATFMKLSSAETSDLAFKGLTSLLPKFKETWIAAELNGAFIIEELRLPSLISAISEIEVESGNKISFTHQRLKIIQNIVNAITEDDSIDEDIREGWRNDFEEGKQSVDETRPTLPHAPPIASDMKASATEVFGSSAHQESRGEPMPKELQSDTKDFRSEFRDMTSTLSMPTVSSDKGKLIARLADGTEIFMPGKDQDRAPQILNYPTLKEFTEEAW